MAYVMIVEDEKDLARTMSQSLTLAGYETQVAHDGDEAIALMKQRLPDIVMSDLEMPYLDGEGLAARMLFEDCGKERIPILVVSGNSKLETVARRIGTPYFAAKPFDFKALFVLLERILRERIAPKPPGLGAPPAVSST